MTAPDAHLMFSCTSSPARATLRRSARRTCAKGATATPRAATVSPSTNTAPPAALTKKRSVLPIAATAMRTAGRA